MNFKNIDPHEPMIRTQFHAFIDSINHCPTSKYFHETLRRYLEACKHTEQLTPEQITAHRYTHENYWAWYRKQTEKAEQMQIEENIGGTMKHIKITYANGDHAYTRINGTVEEIEQYYLGKTFNIGVTKENKQIAIKVEFLGEDK